MPPVPASANFTTTTGAFDRTANGAFDVFATKLNAAGSALVYSTFLGGTSSEGASDVALSASGEAGVTGGTDSSDFPVIVGAADSSFNGMALAQTPHFWRVRGVNTAGVAGPWSAVRSLTPGGATVSLSSSHPIVANVPSAVTVFPGNLGASFSISTTAASIGDADGDGERPERREGHLEPRRHQRLHRQYWLNILWLRYCDHTERLGRT